MFGSSRMWRVEASGFLLGIAVTRDRTCPLSYLKTKQLSSFTYEIETSLIVSPFSSFRSPMR